MPSFVPHAVVPVLAAFAFLPYDRRRVLAWLPIVWVPDLDYLLPEVHRAATHSVFWPLLTFAAVWLLWRRRAPGEAFTTFLRRPGAPANLALASFFLASHVLMDIFAGGVVLLWPLVDANVALWFLIDLDTASNTFTPSGGGDVSAGAPALAPVFPWLSAVDTAVLAFVASTMVAWSLVRRRAPQP